MVPEPVSCMMNTQNSLLAYSAENVCKAAQKVNGQYHLQKFSRRALP